MTVRSICRVLVILILVGSGSALAQQTLGDLVSQGGYDWMLGNWAAPMDEGGTIEYDLAWALDKHVMTVGVKMNEFRYEGMIMYVPSKEEIAQAGIDNAGGIWEGTWYEDYAGAVYKVKHTRRDGETTSAEIVHSKAGADGMKVAMYGLDGSGYRSSQPWTEMTYKRRPKSTGSRSSGSGTSGSAGYDTLGGLLAQYGYDWIIGKWQATDDSGQTYKLNWTWALDENAIVLDLKTDQFSLRSMLAFNAPKEEVIQFGADNMGRTMKGTWGEDYQGAVLRSEVLMPYGSPQKTEHVFSKVDNDTFKVKEYAVESDGWRASSPSGEVTFKRQK